jgi:hypothetical protein
MAVLLRLLLLCILPLGPVGQRNPAGGADDQPGIRSFVAALAQRRPHDHVHFQTSELPRPGKLKADHAPDLLDGPRWSGAWAKPPAHRRWPCGSAGCRLNNAWESRAPRSSACCGATRRWPGNCAWPATCCRRRGASACCTVSTAASCSMNCARPHSPGPGDRRPGLARPARQPPAAEPAGQQRCAAGPRRPRLYNSKTAKNLLLSSYGRQMALIGPNAGFVRAGALASTYSDQDDWLAVLDHLLDQPPHAGRAAFTPRFGVSGNQQVARALGLNHRSERRRLALAGRTHPMSKRLSWDIHTRTQIISLGPALLLTLLLISFFTFVRIQDLRQELNHTGQLIANQLAPASEYGVISGNNEVLEA